MGSTFQSDHHRTITAWFTATTHEGTHGIVTACGGWQDQVGGITRGLKLIETEPGLCQNPVIRWLPDHLFTDAVPRSCMLLYYTGITRVAKNILQEIVRGMFLNTAQHTAILGDLRQHAVATYDALVRGEWSELCQSIDCSWNLNQRLDSGTNTPEIQAILDRVHDYLAAAKLLGAGGGVYMLMLAKDQGGHRPHPQPIGGITTRSQGPLCQL